MIVESVEAEKALESVLEAAATEKAEAEMRFQAQILTALETDGRVSYGKIQQVAKAHNVDAVEVMDIVDRIINRADSMGKKVVDETSCLRLERASA